VSTGVARISTTDGTSKISSESTTKSASIPTFSTPISCSRKAA